MDETGNVVSLPTYASSDKGTTVTITLSSPAVFPTEFGEFEIRAIRDSEGREHAVVLAGNVSGSEDVPVRVHSECLTSEVLQSMRCDCREQLLSAMEQLGTTGLGVLIYLRQEGRGIGFFNKIEAYALQDTGLDTVEANERLGFPVDSRTYEVAATVLAALEVRSVCLMTNNPRKIEALETHGVRVSRRVPIRIEPGRHNGGYLRTKRSKMNHFA